MPRVTSSGKTAIDTVMWVGWADQDYFGARALLLTGLVVQGAVLACTSIEKYLKAVCAISGIPCQNVGHDISRLNGMLTKQAIPQGLDVQFLRYLSKAYKLRYPNDLNPGFNIALNSISTLVQLDLTVSHIRQRFTFQKNGKTVSTKFDEALKRGAQELVVKNCALGGISKAALFGEPSWSYDLRILEDGTVMEAAYAVERIVGDDEFCRHGLAPVEGSEGKSFNLAWLPKSTAQTHE